MKMYRCIDAIINAGKSSSSFFGSYSMSNPQYDDPLGIVQEV